MILARPPTFAMALPVVKAPHPHAELPLKVLLAISSVADSPPSESRFAIAPPPSYWAELPLKVLPIIVASAPPLPPMLNTPPPDPAELPVSVLLLIVSVTFPPPEAEL